MFFRKFTKRNISVFIIVASFKLYAPGDAPGDREFLPVPVMAQEHQQQILGMAAIFFLLTRANTLLDAKKLIDECLVLNPWRLATKSLVLS